MSLIGTLEEIKLADVLRLFAAGKKDGVLTVSVAGTEAQVRFKRGAIVSANAGAVQGDEAVLDLFGWKEGQLTFVPDDKPAIPNVTRPVDALIEEGLRVGDSLHKTRTLVPSDRVVFHMCAAPPDGGRLTLGGEEWRVLRVLDGVRDVREVVEAVKLPRAEVLRVLVEMAQAGFLERLEVQKALRVQAQGRFAKDSAAIDERFEAEWRKIPRFWHGVLRVEIRSLAGGLLALPVGFGPGLIRDIHLPKAAVAELHAREGEDVNVRPLA